jgi:hypothetical protein
MHKVIARRTWSALLATVSTLVLCTTGLTHGEGPHKEWVESLQRPSKIIGLRGSPNPPPRRT